MAQLALDQLKSELKQKEDFWREVFHTADRNGDGTVDVVELKKALNNTRKAKNLSEFSDDQIVSIFSDLDVDGNCKLGEQEFVTEMLKPNRRAAFQAYFKVLDKNKDGKLALAEIRDLYMKFDLTDDEIQEKLSPWDTDNDGFISFDEFMTIV